MRAAQPLRADTVGADMIFLPMALDLITGDTGVSLGFAIGIGGVLLGLAGARAVQGEIQRRHDERIKKLEATHEAAPPAVHAEKIQELMSWKQETTRQLQEFEIYQARMEERSASGSTARGSRPATGRQKRLDQ
jgi:hypothetical protein